MRTFAQKPNQAEGPVLASRTRPAPTTFDAKHQADPLASGRGFSLTQVPAAALAIQRAPAISSPADAYEREADEVADHVMRMAQPASIHSPAQSMPGAAGQAISRKCAACEDEEEKRIQPKAQPQTAAAHQDAPLDAASAVSAIKHGGAPLSGDVRAYFEPRFGHDFSRVRVHADADAARGARAIRARAYTIGSDIAFAPGEYAPATTEGKRLLAHELAHVAQQGYSRQQQGPQIARKETPAAGTSDKQTPQAGPKDPAQVKRDLCIGQDVDESRARCQFTDKQMIRVRIVREAALRIANRAIPAVGMPGNEENVKRLAREYFHLNIKLSQKTQRALVKIIGTVADKLEHAPIECGTCQDEHCNSGAAVAHVDEARTFVVLCPQFFNDELVKVYKEPRYLIHEAAHLARLDRDTTAREEFYCHEGLTKEAKQSGATAEGDKCPVSDAWHNVDAWSYFIEDLSYTI
jgi:hypothetical protein